MLNRFLRSCGKPSHLNSYRLHILNHKQPSFAISRNFGFMNTHYEHPSDVPLGEVPSLGEGEFKGKELDERLFDINQVDVVPRSEEINTAYKNEGQDFPSYILHQTPEMFAPEEPSFWEFQGVYPFLFFGGAIALSKEYFLFFANAPYHVSQIVFPGILAFFVGADHKLREGNAKSDQFIHDSLQIGRTALKNSLDNSIDNCKNDLKFKERAKKFSEFFKSVHARKVLAHSMKREKQFALDISKRLHNIEMAQKSFIRSKKQSVLNDILDSVQNRVLTDEKQKDSYNKAVLNLIITSVKNPNENSFDIGIIKNLYSEYLQEYTQKLDSSVDKDLEMDNVTANLVGAVFKNVHDLKVYKGPKKAPTKFSLRSTGLFDKVGKTHLEKCFTYVDSAQLKKQKIDVVKDQLSNFLPDKQPQPLLDRLKRVSMPTA